VLSQSVDGALLDEVRGRIGALIEKVHLGHLHPEPADQEGCKTCDYRRLCRLYGD